MEFMDKNKVEYEIISMIDQTIQDYIKSITLRFEFDFTILYGWHRVDNKVGQQRLSVTQCQSLLTKILAKITC